ncbi:hypothetical protein [Eel River basin pequenovirus]|nr:hypothetical protein [Eel River basin pequenovirus]
MHRPNRVGEHMLIDLESNEVEYNITTANFTTLAAAFPDQTVVTDVSTVAEEFAFSFNKVDGQTWTLGAGESINIGRFLDGDFLRRQTGPDSAFQINVAGSIGFRSSGGEVLTVDPIIARRSGSTVTASFSTVQNAMINNHKIPACARSSDGNIIHCDVAASVIAGLFNGAAAAFGSNPIGVFWSIQNVGTSNANIQNLRGSLSAWMYYKPLNTFEPER